LAGDLNPHNHVARHVLLELLEVGAANVLCVQNLHCLLSQSEHLSAHNLETLGEDVRHNLTRLQVGIWLNQNKRFLFRQMIDLSSCLVAKLLNFVFSAVNLNLVANIEYRLVYLLISDASQVHFARLHINDLNAIIDRVEYEFVGAFCSGHLIVPGELERHAIILSRNHMLVLIIIN
jgi:hypothetical protein